MRNIFFKYYFYLVESFNAIKGFQFTRLFTSFEIRSVGEGFGKIKG